MLQSILQRKSTKVKFIMPRAMRISWSKQKPKLKYVFEYDGLNAFCNHVITLLSSVNKKIFYYKM